MQKEEITGHVRPATADSLCSRLGRTFRGFWALYPGISLKIVTAGTESLFRLLRHNEVDLGFDAGQPYLQHRVPPDPGDTN